MDFKDSLINQIKNNSLSHAYLIETNDYNRFDLILNVILKSIFCPSGVLFCDNCQDCNYINNSSHPDITKIFPDGNIIKIKQINDLKLQFLNKPFMEKLKVFIIYDVDKLNMSSANALLKFLEEPDDDIIGFLVTTKKDFVIPTIISRCQNYCCYFDNDVYDENIINVANSLDDLVKSSSAVLNIKSFLNDFNDKTIIKCSLAYLLTNELKKENPNILKIKLLYNICNYMRYNVNMELLLENFVLEMSELHE